MTRLEVGLAVACVILALYAIVLRLRVAAADRYLDRIEATVFRVRDKLARLGIMTEDRPGDGE